MPEQPRGTVAFLFTDVEGSTRFWRDFPSAMPAAYARHDAIVRGAVNRHGGVVYKVIGDAFQIAFPAAPAALAAGLEAQLALHREPWEACGLPGPMRIRMALHAGAVDPDPDGDYRSPVLNRLGRLLAVGHGGQVLLSQTAFELARDLLPDGVALCDLGEHALKDLRRPERTWQLLHPDLPEDFPPLATLDRRPHNLPVQPTPLIGREREIAETAALLRQPDTRLLTLTGPGGTGKTRLALQTAAEVLDDFVDGAWFVDLAAIRDPALVGPRIAEALGVREEGGRPLAEALVERLRDKRLLLLDNFEQVMDAAELAHQLLAHCSGVHILVTSRTPLRLRGEREVAVSPLVVPNRHRLPDLDQLSQYEAVRLFIARAQDVKTDFAIDNANAPAVAEICCRLDGLPLAIELAAARVKILPPPALLARLSQRLSVLTGGSRDAPERHRTLRGAIAWSHDLLSRDEQQLFRRLAVFAGGFTLDAAAAVAGMGEDAEFVVLEGISSLVDKSLLVSGADGGEPRFTMLETIREFAAEEFAAYGEETDGRDAHARFFLELAEEAAPHLARMSDPVWLDRLEADHDNLLTALSWVADEDDVARTVCLAGALGWFWYMHGHYQEGRAWLDRALAMEETAAPECIPVLARADARVGRGLLAMTLGEGERSAALLGEAAALRRGTGDVWGGAYADSLRGGVLVSLGRYDEAEAIFPEILRWWQAFGDPMLTAHACFHLGLVAFMKGDRERTATLCQEAVTLYDAAQCGLDAIDPLHYLGLNACAAGDLQVAARHMREALARLRLRRSSVDYAHGLADVATLAQAHGHLQAAARLFGAAYGIRGKGGAPFPLPARDAYERSASSVRNQLGEDWAAAYDAGARLTLEAAIAEAETELASSVDSRPAMSEPPPDRRRAESLSAEEALRTSLTRRERMRSPPLTPGSEPSTSRPPGT